MKRVLIILICYFLLFPVLQLNSMNWIKVAAPDGNIDFIKAEIINDIYYVSPDELCNILLSKHGYNTVSNEIYSDSLKIIFVPFSNFTALVTSGNTELVQLTSNPLIKEDKLYLPLNEVIDIFVSIRVIDAELVNDNLLVYESAFVKGTVVKNEETTYKNVTPKKYNQKNDDPNPNFYRLPDQLKRRNIKQF